MRKILFSSFLFFFGALFLVFLIANRGPVTISFDPFSLENPAVAIGPFPLWVALMGTLFIGYLFGGVGMWISSKSTREKLKEHKREAGFLKEEVSALKSELAERENNLPVIDQ